MGEGRSECLIRSTKGRKFIPALYSVSAGGPSELKTPSFRANPKRQPSYPGHVRLLFFSVLSPPPLVFFLPARKGLSNSSLTLAEEVKPVKVRTCGCRRYVYYLFIGLHGRTSDSGAIIARCGNGEQFLMRRTSTTTTTRELALQSGLQTRSETRNRICLSTRLPIRSRRKVRALLHLSWRNLSE